MIAGLLLVRAGYPLADPIAALVVAVIVLIASGRLMKANADILLDRIQPAAVARARDALRSLQPHIEVERLRVRSAAGRHFADAVVTVAPGAALAEAHEAADAVEAALESVLPNMDAVVHVEPGDGPIDERVRAAAQTVPGVREVHNVRLFTIEGSHEVSLHLKLPGDHEISEAELKAAIDEVLKLNPKPASAYAPANSRGTQYVVPDFFLFNRDGELELTLNNRNAPDLRISDQYRDMLKAYRAHARQGKTNREEKEAVMFIKQKIDSAKWFIDAIRQRYETMYNTMYTIMQYQYDFFLTGDPKKLRPMILKDIADITGLDISTVSRVANSKFVQTEFGTKRLKEFFSESLSTQEGEEVSTLEVKKILEEVIAQENKRKPLSDQKLQKVLEDKGYNIARRTVAKYREQLNIPVARLRKEL